MSLKQGAMPHVGPMTSTNFAEATQHLEDLRDAIADLNDVYSDGSATPQLVGKFQNEIRHSAKVAELHGLLAIAERLDELVQVLGVGTMPGVRGRPLSPTQLDPCPVGGFHAYDADDRCSCGATAS